MKLLVNASNLHVGGGVTVASSVIAEMSSMDCAATTSVLASVAVATNLKGLGIDPGSFADFHVYSPFGPMALLRRPPVRHRDFDVILNVFGPSYLPGFTSGSVTGIAQPWVVFPHNLAYQKLSAPRRIVYRAGSAVMATIFARAAVLVAEQEAVREGLLSQRRFRGKDVRVVPNVLDSVYYEPSRWEPVDVPSSGAPLRLGLTSRNYPHKNLSILPDVRRRLRDSFDMEVDFVVTFTDREWRATSEDFRANVLNAGPLRLPQCPTFNQELDGVVFPSLLECFSATPIEAKAVGVPLFASDIPVIRDTVGDYASYFDPLDAGDIARVIAAYYQREGVSGARQRVTDDVAPSYTSAQRAERLVEICRDVFRRSAGRRSPRATPRR